MTAWLLTGRPHPWVGRGTPSGLASSSLDARLCQLMLAYVSILGTEAALRWGLHKCGADVAIYVKDLLLYAVGGLAVWQGIRRRQDVRCTAALCWVFLVLGLAGLASGLELAQVLFGLKVWMAFIVGFVLVDAGAVSALNRPRVWFGLWLFLCAGIFLNRLTPMPWAGLSTEIGDTTIEVNRNWNTWGIRRVSGFARSSFDSAMLLLALYVYLATFMRGAWLRLGLFLGTAVAIGLTTTKGALGALACLAVFLPLQWLPRAWLGLVRVPGLLMLMGFGLVGLLAPALSTQFPAPTFAPFSLEAILFASLADRGWTTWPDAFALMEPWQMLLGRGLGGIGAAQNVFEKALFCPADNLFVFLFVTGGALAALYYVGLLVLAWRLRFDVPVQWALFLLLVVLFSYGMTASLIDNAPFAFAMGLATAALLPRAVAPAASPDLQVPAR